MNISWNAEKYADNFSFVPKYGLDVISLIGGGSNQFVVDLGCGNGALTKKLAESGYDTIGIDDSESMLDAARKSYPELRFIKGNAVNFSLEKKADVIFSNAVFHWIEAEKQDDMLANIYSQLKFGGQLVCEFGGKGCAEAVHSTLEQCFAERGLTYRRTFYFPSVGEYAQRLEKAGFRVEYAVLFDRPTEQKGESGLRDWIKMFDGAPFEGIDAPAASDILREAEQRLRPILHGGELWIIDYVRLRIRAVKK